MSSTPMKAEASAGGDLGYTWGKQTIASVSNHYIRVWTRKAEGTWQLVADITTPPAPPTR